MTGVALVRWILYRSGLAGLAHRVRNRRTLTVVAFHRVLDPADPRWEGADPAWTLSVEQLGACLRFFARHYRVVSMERVLDALEGGAPLPGRSLLITFDDGWADTAEYGLPALRAAGLPAAVFVASDAVGRAEPFWQEALFAAWRAGRLSAPGAAELWRAAGDGVEAPLPERGEEALVRRLIARLEALPAARRAELLGARPGLRAGGERPAMLGRTQLRALLEAGVHVGSHGASHEPLTAVEDPVGELRGSRARLAELSGERAPRTLSFPHGRFDEALLEEALLSGYGALFTSEEGLNGLSKGVPAPVLGRLPVDARQLSDRAGRLRPERLAGWLFARPRCAPRP